MSFTIRPATVADIPAIAFIHVAGWRDSYGCIVRRDFLDSLSTQEKEKNWGEWFKDSTMQVLLALDGAGKPCGFISFGKLRTPIPGGSPIRPPYSAEVYAIYILPEAQRQGLGRQLMCAAALKLKDMKHKSLSLWVVEKNEKAVNFYKKLGGQRCGKKDIEVGGTKIKEIAFGWRDTSVFLS